MLHGWRMLLHSVGTNVRKEDIVVSAASLEQMSKRRFGSKSLNKWRKSNRNGERLIKSLSFTTIPPFVWLFAQHVLVVVGTSEDSESVGAKGSNVAMVEASEINGYKDHLTRDALAFKTGKSLGVVDDHRIGIRTSICHLSGLLVIQPSREFAERIGFYMFDLKHVTAI